MGASDHACGIVHGRLRPTAATCSGQGRAPGRWSLAVTRKSGVREDTTNQSVRCEGALAEVKQMSI